MKKIFKKKIFIHTICIMMIPVFAGCGNFSWSNSKNVSDAVTQVPTQNVTLTIEVGQEGVITFPTTFYKPNLDAFELKYPNIKVKLLLIPETQIKKVIQTKLASGQPSDVICYNKISGENELDAIKNFTDLSKEPWVARLENPDVLKAPDGKIYGFALQNFIHCLAMVYNTAIFDELKLSEPRNYNEFLKVCEVIKANGITPIYAPFGDMWTFQIWTTSSWGYIAEKKRSGLWAQINSGKVKWTDIPEFQDTLQKGLDLYTKGYMQKTLLSDDYNGAPNVFIKKECAMMISTSDFVTLMQKKAPDLKLDIFPIQAFSENNPCVAQGQLGALLSVPNKAQHVKEGKMFIDFITQKEQVDRAQAAGAYVPMVKDASTPKLTAFQQEIVNKYIKADKTVTEMNAYMKVDPNDLWKYYQDMFIGAKTPRQVLEAWDKKFAELMREKGEPGF